MGSPNSLQVLFEIDVDPSKADAAMANFEKTSGKSFAAAGAAVRPFNDQILSGRESARLLTEELGVRLPRAVTGSIAEIMPSINMLGPALLGVFAVEGIVKFIEYLHKAAGAANEIAQSQKAVHIVADENATAMEKMAKKSLEYARSQLALLNIQAVAGERSIEALKKHEEGADQALAAFIPVMNAYHFILGESSELKEAEEGLTTIYKMRDSLIKILGEDEAKEHAQVTKSAKDSASETERNTMTIRRWHEEMIKAGQEAGKVAVALARQNDEVGASAIRAAQAELQFAMDLERFGVVEQKDYNWLKQYTPAAQAAEAETRKLAEARKFLAGATQDAEQVEDAFRKALQGDRQAMDGMLESAEQAGEAVASMTKSTKLVAYVRGGYDTAKAIECMAAFIESYGTDVAQFAASLEWAAAADQQFSVAGQGSRHGGGGAGGGGGGAASARANSYGGRGAYGGSSDRQGGGGGGGSGAGPGATVHINNYGPVVSDANSTQQLFDQWNQQVQNGSLWNVSSMAAIQGPTATGRG